MIIKRFKNGGKQIKKKRNNFKISQAFERSFIEGMKCKITIYSK